MKHWTDIKQKPRWRRLRFVKRDIEVKPDWFVKPTRLVFK